jgi:hypothetical protein
MQRAGHRASVASDAVFLWLASVVTLCAGCSITFGVLGRAIDAQHEQTASIAESALADARTVAGRPVLERQAQLIDGRLRDLALDADTPSTVARFIRVAAQTAVQRHVELERIEERGATLAAVPAGLPQPAVAFEPIPLDVTLRGDYRSLLATIRALAVAPVTMEIEIATLERDGPPAGGATPAATRLTARLHVALQHLAPTPLTVVPSHSLAKEQTIHARSF